MIEENQTEVWKEIEGFSRYMVSPNGEVLDTKTGKLIAKQLAGKPQYYYVNVNRDDGQRKLKRVHRFVAEAYVGGRSEDYNVVDHIDRDKFNNHYTNLRWTDHSGNQRNTENNIFIDGEHLVDFVQKYDNPDAAYTYLTSNLSRGMTQQEALDKYQEYLDYGNRRRQVEWEGSLVYLTDLCETFKKDYDTVRTRLSQGWDIWNAIYNININDFRFSFEAKGKTCVTYWFTSKNHFLIMHTEPQLRYIEEGGYYEDALLIDRLDHLRQTVLGITGTIKELCKHFGISEGCVSTRLTKKGWSLEKSLTTPQERIRRWSIDGETKSIKDWCIHYGLDSKLVNGWKSNKPGRTFKDALIHYGVDCEGKEFQPGD